MENTKTRGRVAISLAKGPVDIAQRIFLAVLIAYFFPWRSLPYLDDRFPS
mgnify:CR=1 FL=1